MNKKLFLNKLSKGLKPIIPSERKKYINDYEEIINDMVEGGLSEEEAVEKQGDISKIVENILKDTDKELLAKKDIFSTVVFIVAVLFFVVSVICILFLPEVGVFSIMKQDGPTAVFVAGKIKEPVWLYILGMCLIFSAGIYFIVRKNTKSAIILVVLTVILGVMFVVRDDIRDIEKKNNIEVTEKSIEEKSKEIIYLLDEGQYQLLQEEYCAEMMKPYMTEEYVTEAKKYLCDAWGENISIGNIFVQDVVQNGESVKVVQIKVNYENVGITYTIMYDEEQLIIGLYMM